MRILTEEQKPNWPTYVPSLVYAYNSTPHASTGFQSYELMFGHKAPTPCDDWLGLVQYKSDSFKSKTVWLKQQLNAMMHAKNKPSNTSRNPISIIKARPQVRNW